MTKRSMGAAGRRIIVRAHNGTDVDDIQTPFISIERKSFLYARDKKEPPHCYLTDYQWPVKTLKTFSVYVCQINKGTNRSLIFNSFI